LNKIKHFLTTNSLKFPKQTIVLFLLLNAFLIIGIPYIVQDDDMVKLLPRNIGTVTTFEDIREEFGNSEFMYIGIGHKNLDAFNPDLLQIIWEISEELEDFEPIEEIISISTASKIYFEKSDSSIVVDNLMPQKFVNANQLDSMVQYLNENQQLKINIVSENEDFHNIVVRPRSNDKYADITYRIHEITDKYSSYDNNGIITQLDYHYGGQAYVTGAVPELVASEVKVLVLYGLVLMCLILLINLRNVPAVTLIISIISLSLFGMLGFMGWIYNLTKSEMFYFTLNHTSMPIVLLTIANSDGVHVIGRFFKELRISKNINNAIHKTMDHLTMPISLTSLTTALAFLILIFSPLNGMNGYGIVLAFGICWAWLLSLTLLPSLISLIKWDVNSKAITRTSLLEKLINKFGLLVTKNPKKIFYPSLLFIGLSIFGLTLIKVEVNYINMFREGNIIRDSAYFLDENMTGNLNLMVNIVAKEDGALKDPENLQKINNIENYLDSIDVVTTTISINDIIKQLHKTVENGDERFYTIPDTRAKVNNLFFLYGQNDDSDLSKMINYENNSTLLISLMKTFSTTQMSEYKNTIENFISKELQNTDLSFRLSGIMAILSEFIWLVIKSSFISIGLSILIIYIVCSIFFKSWKFGLLSIIPLVSAIIVNFGLMGLFGVELTHMTAILSSIIIGVGVDFSIHYTSEYRELIKSKEHNKTIKTINNVGHPILLDALSNMGFASLMLSSIIPMAQIGGLMVFAMAACSFGTLTILASSIEYFKHKL
jgi:predicted RND superfamily exporter protein